MIGDNRCGSPFDAWDLARRPEVPELGLTVEGEDNKVISRDHLELGSCSSFLFAGDLTATSATDLSQARRFDDEPWWYPALTPLHHRQSAKSGTWQFISGLLLLDPAKDHERADDLESVLYVLVYVALHCQRSSLTLEGLMTTIKDIFDALRTIDNVQSGGAGKQSFFAGRILPPDVVTVSFPAPLACLINQIRLIFKNRYATPSPSIDSVRASRRDATQREWDRYYQDRETAREELLTSDTVIQMFEECLEMEGWVEEEAPDDRLHVRRGIGRNLWEFKHLKDTVQAVCDILEVHQEALERFGILHRDISVGNILIGDGGRGLLIDWDLARQVPKLGIIVEDEEHEIAVRHYLKPDSSSGTSSAGGPSTAGASNDSAQAQSVVDDYYFPALTPLHPRQLARSGTWQSLSGLLLLNPSKDHGRADDLESALHVLVYVAFRYQNSSLSDEVLIEEMKEVFDNFRTVEDVHSGGAGKKQFFLGDMLSPDVVAASFPEPLASLINQLRDTFANLYTRRPDPIPDSARPKQKISAQRKWDKYHEDQKLAEAELSTSDAVIETFKECLAMDGWGDEEAPKDRLERMPKTAGALKLAYNRKRARSFATPTSNKKFKKDTGTGD